MMANSDTALIVIPARYGSTRFPGKPLTMIAGQTMLQRVCNAAQQAATELDNVAVLVATDDERILQHCQEINVPAIITPADCESGSDRINAAIATLDYQPSCVINLQGDAPLTPVSVISALITAKRTVDENTVVTPVVQLTWEELDNLRNAKREHPFSGTTVITDSDENAVWFSKNIIPAIRKEETLRINDKISPVLQHLGLYAYSSSLLTKFTSWQPGKYEQLEGLEQLRFLENGIKIKTVAINLHELETWRGVDTPADAAFIEKLILETCPSA